MAVEPLITEAAKSEPGIFGNDKEGLLELTVLGAAGVETEGCGVFGMFCR